MTLLPCRTQAKCAVNLDEIVRSIVERRCRRVIPQLAERVKAGLQNAKRRGKRLGRPQIAVDPAHIGSLRSSGASRRQISSRLGVSVRTIRRVALGRGKILTENGDGTP